MDTFRKNKPGIPEVIAGPCSAEEPRTGSRYGAGVARDRRDDFPRRGLENRTRPGCFEGVRAEALEWIAEAKRLYGMRTLTETATPEHLAAAVKRCRRRMDRSENLHQPIRHARRLRTPLPSFPAKRGKGSNLCEKSGEPRHRAVDRAIERLRLAGVKNSGPSTADSATTGSISTVIRLCGASR